MTLNGVMALFCVISANSGSFRVHCVKVHVRYLISWWVLVYFVTEREAPSVVAWSFNVTYFMDIFPKFVAKSQEAHVRSRSCHDLGCGANFWDVDVVPVDGHHQGSLHTVWRLQQCRHTEDELVCDISGCILSAADTDDLLLFTHCLRIAFQGIKAPSTV